MIINDKRMTAQPNDFFICTITELSYIVKVSAKKTDKWTKRAQFAMIINTSIVIHQSTDIEIFADRNMIEKHGGIIWVESEEGKGSAFHLTVSKK